MELLDESLESFMAWLVKRHFVSLLLFFNK
jgi:hypothetical protein